MIQRATPHVDKNEAGNAAMPRDKYPGTTWRLEGEFIRITIPIKFKRRGGRKQIILPDGTTVAPASDSRRSVRATAGKAAPQPAAQSAIVTALARAFKWQGMLDSGEIASIAALAKRLRMEKSNVARVLRLTCLAPDIIEACVNGTEPDGLSLTKLFRVKAILWTEQRKELGFPSK